MRESLTQRVVRISILFFSTFFTRIAIGSNWHYVPFTRVFQPSEILATHDLTYDFKQQDPFGTLCPFSICDHQRDDNTGQSNLSQSSTSESNSPSQQFAQAAQPLLESGMFEREFRNRPETELSYTMFYGNATQQSAQSSGNAANSNSPASNDKQWSIDIVQTQSYQPENPNKILYLDEAEYKKEAVIYDKETRTWKPARKGVKVTTLWGTSPQGETVALSYYMHDGMKIDLPHPDGLPDKPQPNVPSINFNTTDQSTPKETTPVSISIPTPQQSSQSHQIIRSPPRHDYYKDFMQEQSSTDRILDKIRKYQENYCEKNPFLCDIPGGGSMEERCERNQEDARRRAAHIEAEHRRRAKLPPEYWLAKQKREQTPDYELFTHFDYWQYSGHVGKLLHEIPGFRAFIRTLSDKIKEDPDFMSDEVAGLGYVSRNKEKYKEMLGDNPLGWIVGSITSMQKLCADYSKFHQLVETYENFYNEREQDYFAKLRQSKINALEPPADDPYAYAPLPVHIELPSFDDAMFVGHLAQEYASLSATIPHTPAQLPYRDRIIARSNALKTAALTTYTYADHIVKLDRGMLEAHPELIHIARFTGNAAQLHLHTELGAEINRAGSLLKERPDSPMAQTQAPLIAALSNVASTQENPLAAFHFSDACYHLNHLTELVNDSLKIVTKGVGTGLVNSAEQWGKFVINPVGQSIESIIAVGELATNTLCAAYTLAFGSRDEAQLVLDKAWEKVGYFYEHPEHAVALITQCIVPAPGIGKAFKAANSLKIPQKLTQCFERQAVIAGAVATGGKKGAALKHSLQVGAASAEKVKKHIKVGNGAGGKSMPSGPKPVFVNTVGHALHSEVVKYHGKTMPYVNWKHVFECEARDIKKAVDKLKGFHSEHVNLTNGRIKILSRTPPNAQGVYSCTILERGIEKTTTMFPSSWDLRTLSEKAREAYTNGLKSPHLQDKTSGLVGYTSENIRIRFWFCKDSNGTCFINSMYPEIPST